MMEYYNRYRAGPLDMEVQFKLSSLTHGDPYSVFSAVYWHLLKEGGENLIGTTFCGMITRLYIVAEKGWTWPLLGHGRDICRECQNRTQDDQRG